MRQYHWWNWMNCIYVLQNKRVTGVYCHSNRAALVNLDSTIKNGLRLYSCVCRGESSVVISSAFMECTISYWECPRTTKWTFIDRAGDQPGKRGGREHIKNFIGIVYASMQQTHIYRGRAFVREPKSFRVRVTVYIINFCEVRERGRREDTEGGGGEGGEREWFHNGYNIHTK